MTSAGKAILAELERISQAEHAGLRDGEESKATFGMEPWDDQDMQEFIMAGFEFAAGRTFQKKMAVAIAWIHLGYRAALNEVKE